MAAIVPAPEGVVFREDRLHAYQGVVAAGARRRKWVPDERVDGFVREAYNRMVLDNYRQAIQHAAVRTGWPKWAITRRAVELGLSRIKEANWRPAEIAILEEHTQYGMEVIRRKLLAAGFMRSRNAILLKRQRMDLVKAYDGYSATSLAKLMGIDAHAVGIWIGRGMLAAEKRGTDRTAKQGGDSYYIRPGDVRAFLFAHADEWDLRKVEKWWFLELVTDGKITK
jgi:hypothetical protein